MFCSSCGGQNDDQAKFCTGCGQALGGSTPQPTAPPPAPPPQSAAPGPAPSTNAGDETKKVGVLLGLGIFVMPFLFAWFTLRKGHTTVAKAASFGWLALMFVSMAVQEPTPRTASTSTSSAPAASAPAAAAVPAPAPKPKAAPSFVKESCYQLSKQFGASSKLSELQKDELWKQYKGKNFKWKLKVTEVSSDMFGGFSVQYKCGGRSDSFVQDIQVKYSDADKGLVMQLQKDSTYEVTGRLKTSGSLLGMTGDYEAL